MGIKDLHQLLHPLIKPSHIREFAGCIVAIDASGWIYHASYGASLELSLECPSNSYLKTLQSRCEMLLEYGVIPVFVFDGAPLLSKLQTSIERKTQREKSIYTGFQYLIEASQLQQEDTAAAVVGPNIGSMPQLSDAKRKQYQGLIQKAVTCFQRANQRSLFHTIGFQHVLSTLGIPFVVAPYEADAQIGYLYRKQLIHVAMSDDSDLVLFGCGVIASQLAANGSCMVLDIRPAAIESLVKRYENVKIMMGISPMVESREYSQFIPIGGTGHEGSAVTRTSLIADYHELSPMSIYDWETDLMSKLWHTVDVDGNNTTSRHDWPNTLSNSDGMNLVVTSSTLPSSASQKRTPRRTIRGKGVSGVGGTGPIPIYSVDRDLCDIRHKRGDNNDDNNEDDDDDILLFPTMGGLGGNTVNACHDDSTPFHTSSTLDDNEDVILDIITKKAVSSPSMTLKSKQPINAFSLLKAGSALQERQQQQQRNSGKSSKLDPEVMSGKALPISTSETTATAVAQPLPDLLASAITPAATCADNTTYMNRPSAAEDITPAIAATTEPTLQKDKNTTQTNSKRQQRTYTHTTPVILDMDDDNDNNGSGQDAGHQQMSSSNINNVEAMLPQTVLSFYHGKPMSLIQPSSSPSLNPPQLAQCLPYLRKSTSISTSSEDPLSLRTFLNGHSFEALGGTKQHRAARDYRRTLQLFQLTHRQFTEVCVLSGCDYLSSLPGIGLKTALDYYLRCGCDADHTISFIQQRLQAKVDGMATKAKKKAGVETTWTAAKTKTTPVKANQPLQSMIHDDNDDNDDLDSNPDDDNNGTDDDNITHNNSDHMNNHPSPLDDNVPLGKYQTPKLDVFLANPSRCEHLIEQYRQQFHRAVQCFLFQWVIDPVRGRFTHVFDTYILQPPCSSPSIPSSGRDESLHVQPSTYPPGDNPVLHLTRLFIQTSSSVDDLALLWGSFLAPGDTVSIPASARRNPRSKDALNNNSYYNSIDDDGDHTHMLPRHDSSPTRRGDLPTPAPTLTSPTANGIAIPLQTLLSQMLLCCPLQASFQPTTQNALNMFPSLIPATMFHSIKEMLPRLFHRDMSVGRRRDDGEDDAGDETNKSTTNKGAANGGGVQANNNTDFATWSVRMQQLVETVLRACCTDADTLSGGNSSGGGSGEASNIGESDLNQIPMEKRYQTTPVKQTPNRIHTVNSPSYTASYTGYHHDQDPGEKVFHDYHKSIRILRKFFHLIGLLSKPSICSSDELHTILAADESVITHHTQSAHAPGDASSFLSTPSKQRFNAGNASQRKTTSDVLQILQGMGEMTSHLGNCLPDSLAMPILTGQVDPHHLVLLPHRSQILSTMSNRFQQRLSRKHDDNLLRRVFTLLNDLQSKRFRYPITIDPVKISLPDGDKISTKHVKAGDALHSAPLSGTTYDIGVPTSMPVPMDDDMSDVNHTPSSAQDTSTPISRPHRRTSPEECQSNTFILPGKWLPPVGLVCFEILSHTTRLLEDNIALATTPSTRVSLTQTMSEKRLRDAIVTNPLFKLLHISPQLQKGSSSTTGVCDLSTSHSRMQQYASTTLLSTVVYAMLTLPLFQQRKRLSLPLSLSSSFTSLSSALKGWLYISIEQSPLALFMLKLFLHPILCARNNNNSNIIVRKALPSSGRTMTRSTVPPRGLEDACPHLIASLLGNQYTTTLLELIPRVSRLHLPLHIGNILLTNAPMMQVSLPLGMALSTHQKQHDDPLFTQIYQVLGDYDIPPSSHPKPTVVGGFKVVRQYTATQLNSEHPLYSQVCPNSVIQTHLYPPFTIIRLPHHSSWGRGHHSDNNNHGQHSRHDRQSLGGDGDAAQDEQQTDDGLALDDMVNSDMPPSIHKLLQTAQLARADHAVGGQNGAQQPGNTTIDIVIGSKANKSLALSTHNTNNKTDWHEVLPTSSPHLNLASPIAEYYQRLGFLVVSSLPPSESMTATSLHPQQQQSTTSATSSEQCGRQPTLVIDNTMVTLQQVLKTSPYHSQEDTKRPSAQPFPVGTTPRGANSTSSFNSSSFHLPTLSLDPVNIWMNLSQYEDEYMTVMQQTSGHDNDKHHQQPRTISSHNIVPFYRVITLLLPIFSTGSPLLAVTPSASLAAYTTLQGGTRSRSWQGRASNTTTTTNSTPMSLARAPLQPQTVEQYRRMVRERVIPSKPYGPVIQAMQAYLTNTPHYSKMIQRLSRITSVDHGTPRRMNDGFTEQSDLSEQDPRNTNPILQDDLSSEMNDGDDDPWIREFLEEALGWVLPPEEGSNPAGGDHQISSSPSSHDIHSDPSYEGVHNQYAASTHQPTVSSTQIHQHQKEGKPTTNFNHTDNPFEGDDDSINIDDNPFDIDDNPFNTIEDDKGISDNNPQAITPTTETIILEDSDDDKDSYNGMTADNPFTMDNYEDDSHNVEYSTDNARPNDSNHALDQNHHHHHHDTTTQTKPTVQGPSSMPPLHPLQNKPTPAKQPVSSLLLALRTSTTQQKPTPSKKTPISTHSNPFARTTEKKQPSIGRGDRMGYSGTLSSKYSPVKQRRLQMTPGHTTPSDDDSWDDDDDDVDGNHRHRNTKTQKAKTKARTTKRAKKNPVTPQRNIFDPFDDLDQELVPVAPITTTDHISHGEGSNGDGDGVDENGENNSRAPMSKMKNVVNGDTKNSIQHTLPDRNPFATKISTTPRASENIKPNTTNTSTPGRGNGGGGSSINSVKPVINPFAKLRTAKEQQQQQHRPGLPGAKSSVVNEELKRMDLVKELAKNAQSSSKFNEPYNPNKKKKFFR